MCMKNDWTKKRKKQKTNCVFYGMSFYVYQRLNLLKLPIPYSMFQSSQIWAHTQRQPQSLTRAICKSTPPLTQTHWQRPTTTTTKRTHIVLKDKNVCLPVLYTSSAIFFSSLLAVLSSVMNSTLLYRFSPGERENVQKQKKLHTPSPHTSFLSYHRGEKKYSVYLHFIYTNRSTNTKAHMTVPIQQHQRGKECEEEKTRIERQKKNTQSTRK